jgi:hypothetical protein
MIRYFTLASLILLAPALFAARPEGSVAKKDGNAVAFKSLDAETLSGIEWKDAAKQSGTRIEIWDVDQVRYSYKGMDQFNSLSKKLLSGRGDVLEKDAGIYVSDPGKDFEDDDKRRIKLTALYYVARGKLLQGSADAASSFLEYLKECEAQAKEGEGKAGNPKNFVKGVAFDSPTGNKVAEAGLLHRLYLDALEGLGESYVRAGSAEEGAKKGYDKLVELTTSLAKKSSKYNYYDWALRALKAAASVAENSQGERKDVAKRTREVYVKLADVALLRAGGKKSRETIEANLKVGLLMIEEGNASGAQGRFSGPIREWENEQKDYKNQPKNNWITADSSFEVAGCYLGLGMVAASNAKTAAEWAGALRYFANSIGMFAGDAEFRGQALLGAAKACAEMAKGTKEKDAAARHAMAGEIYLLELRTTLGSTKAANSSVLPEITKLIDTYKTVK